MKIGVSSGRDELVHYLELKINLLDKDKILREHVRHLFACSFMVPN